MKMVMLRSLKNNSEHGNKIKDGLAMLMLLYNL